MEKFLRELIRKFILSDIDVIKQLGVEEYTDGIADACELDDEEYNYVKSIVEEICDSY